MEFLRFGSSIPGCYWGCCAVCIIQNFNFDPDSPYSIELVSGDGGEPISGLFLGKTYREVFETRMRIGTFSEDEMPNHAFFAVMTDFQLTSAYGSKWLKLLKEHGFEFIRTVDNSVYTGQSLKGDDNEEEDWCEESHPNHIFGLFRNIGAGAVNDPFKPPQAWLDLEGGTKEWYTCGYWTEEERDEVVRDLQESRDKVHLAKWQEGSTKFYKRDELERENIPVHLAGRRSHNPQEPAKAREERHKRESAVKVSTPAPFSLAPAF